jgi:hypothetical protein
MLKPSKPNVDLKFSVIHVGALIIKAIKDKGLLTFDKLLPILIDKTGERVKEIYLPSLCFLFLVGKIRYHIEIDSLEFIN